MFVECVWKDCKVLKVRKVRKKKCRSVDECG